VKVARLAAVLALVSRVGAFADEPAPAAEIRIRHEGGKDEGRIPCETLGGVEVVVSVSQELDGFQVSVEVPEPPGPGMGLLVRWADAEDPSRQHWVSYRPQDLRGPEWSGTVPDSGWRTGWGSLFPGTWSAGVHLPPAVGSDKVPRPFLLAVAVTGRLPNRVAFAPTTAPFSGPSTWTKVVPTEEIQGRTGSQLGAYDPVERKKADDVRLRAWREHLDARVKGGPPATARERLVGPLDEAVRARHDLVMLHVVKGDTLRDLGDLDGAQAAYDEAVMRGPHFPETRWARERLRAMRWLDRKPSDPSDYKAAFARIAEGAKDAPPGSPAPALAEGLLRYRAGEFDDSIRFLASFAKTHAFDEEIAETVRFAEQARQAWGPERAYRLAEERKGDLPRVRLVTSKGAAVYELFETQAPNTVANFVWLAKHGFYDGTRFHRATPFSALRGGDPLSREDKGDVGKGGPGWAIPAEPDPDKRRRREAPPPRRGFRGAIAMDDDGSNTAGSRFLLLTGTTWLPDDQNTVFGRVVEGQDVVERLVRGDVLEKVEVVRTRAHEYRPTTVAGELAPVPARR
jgi:cyclophilin family peptidyl-prolyl cis-trans isomerase